MFFPAFTIKYQLSNTISDSFSKASNMHCFPTFILKMNKAAEKKTDETRWKQQVVGYDVVHQYTAHRH